MAGKASKGYSRVDSKDKRVHGWLVRIKRGDLKRSRFISDVTHGGKRKSMEVAKAVYQEWLSELPPATTSLNKVTRRNASGVVGVHFSSDTDARYPNCKYDSYIASWTREDGRRMNVRFSCNKHGKEEAFTLACIARNEKESDREKVLSLYNRRKPKKGGSKPTKKSKK